MHASVARRLVLLGRPRDGDLQPLVIAHRGATSHAPENSLAAFEAAIAAGVDMVELDVRLTADDVLVVHHDSTVRGVPVSRLTMAELREQREAVTTLEDAASLCSGRIAVDVEVKVAGIEQRVVDVVHQSFDADSVVVTSLLEPVIAEVKSRAPELVCGLLLGLARLTRAFGSRPLAWMARCGADILLPHQALVPAGGGERSFGRRLLLAAQTRAVPVVVWTVNRPDRIARYYSHARVAGVITDAPELASEARAAALGGSGGGPVTGPAAEAFRSQVRPGTRG